MNRKPLVEKVDQRGAINVKARGFLGRDWNPSWMSASDKSRTLNATLAMGQIARSNAWAEARPNSDYLPELCEIQIEVMKLVTLRTEIYRHASGKSPLRVPSKKSCNPEIELLVYS